MRKLPIVLSILALLLACGAQASTLEDVKKRGKLLCGVNPGLTGFAEAVDKKWAGFDVDFCRAVAAAVLSDPEKVDYVPLDVKSRFDALKSGKVDILARNTTWTMERELKYGIRFAGVNYYDGQGFMAPLSIGVDSVLKMNQAAVCFINGTANQAGLEDFFKEKEMIFTPVGFDKIDDLIPAYESGKCDAFTTDQSQLYAVRLKLKNPADHIILPDVISKVPLGPAVRQGDEQWFSIVRGTFYALVNAEELEVTQAGVDDLKGSSKSPSVRRLLGAEGTLGADMGLDADWAARAIKSVGNYGQMFERNLGQGSKLAIERGVNALWSKGGLLYVPPLQ
jgi:general L-amino acid transport system substrate-binding protein